MSMFSKITKLFGRKEAETVEEKTDADAPAPERYDTNAEQSLATAFEESVDPSEVVEESETRDESDAEQSSTPDANLDQSVNEQSQADTAEVFEFKPTAFTLKPLEDVESQAQEAGDTPIESIVESEPASDAEISDTESEPQPEAYLPDEEQTAGQPEESSPQQAAEIVDEQDIDEVSLEIEEASSDITPPDEGLVEITDEAPIDVQDADTEEPAEADVPVDSSDIVDSVVEMTDADEPEQIDYSQDEKKEELLEESTEEVLEQETEEVLEQETEEIEFQQEADDDEQSAGVILEGDEETFSDPAEVAAELIDFGSTAPVDESVEVAAEITPEDFGSFEVDEAEADSGISELEQAFLGVNAADEVESLESDTAVLEEEPNVQTGLEADAPLADQWAEDDEVESMETSGIETVFQVQTESVEVDDAAPGLEEPVTAAVDTQLQDNEENEAMEETGDEAGVDWDELDQIISASDSEQSGGAADLMDSAQEEASVPPQDEPQVDEPIGLSTEAAEPLVDAPVDAEPEPEEEESLVAAAAIAQGAGAALGSSYPNLPTKDVPAGQVWPPVSGRELVGEIQGYSINDIAWQGPDWQGLLAGKWRVASSPEWIFSNREEGKVKLLDQVRRNSKVERLLSSPRCIVLAESGNDQHAIWHIVQQHTGIQEVLQILVAMENVSEAALELHRCMAKWFTSLDALSEALAEEDVKALDLAEVGGKLVYNGFISSGGSGGDSLKAQLASMISDMAKSAGNESALAERLAQLSIATDVDEQAKLFLEQALAA